MHRQCIGCKFFSSLLSLLFKHFFVGLHFCFDCILLCLENCQCHGVQMVPQLIVVHSQVGSHSLNDDHEILDATINVRFSWISGCAKNVGNSGLLIIFDEVPNSHVRSKGCNEFAFLIFFLTQFERIFLLLLFDLFSSGS